MPRQRPRRHKWQLQFASMSDIAFLLIIFFAVCGKLKKQDGDVVLPDVDLGVQTEVRDITILVTKEGKFEVNGTPVEPEALQDEVDSFMYQGMTDEERTVVILADRDAQYGLVAAAIEAVNKADAYLELAVRSSR